MPATPTPMPVPYLKSRVLLVEGNTPLNFFQALSRELMILDSLDIRSFGGINQLGTFLTVAARTESFRVAVRSLGIVRDAEADAVAARAAVESAIKAAGLPAGVTAKSYILPGGNSPGNIETLCLQSVEGHEAYPCVGEFVRCTAQRGVTWPEGHQRDKALVQVFAATLPEPQPYAGLAAHRKAWPWGSPAFTDLIKFLNDL